MRARLAALLTLLLAGLLPAGCSSTTAGTPRAAGFACTGSNPQRVTACLRTSLRTFWSAELGKRVDEKLIVDPQRELVPAGCRTALGFGSAFYCPPDATVYITADYLAWMRSAFPGTRIVYALAAAQAHEMGHTVQYAVKDKLATRQHTTDAQSRRIEQQADCLSGVWSAHSGIDYPRFLSAARREYAYLNGHVRVEVRFHGNVDTRLAALRRGHDRGKPAACGLHVR